MLFNSHGLVFVGRRIDTPGEAWQLPQGGIEGDEDPALAVLRELAEEIGTDKAQIVAQASRWYRYDLPDGLADQVWRGRFRGQEQLWFALSFTGTDADIDLAASGHPEFDAWKWSPVAELPAMAVAFKRHLYQQLVVEFEPLALQLRRTSEIDPP
jgi:putative (di)nucleoside polyphosphate hydrolase